MADYVNKVILNGQTEPLIDISGDTATAATVLSGYTFHYKSGETLTGTCAYDADTSDATAGEYEILSGQTAYVDGAKVTGKMVNRGAVSATITDASTPYTVPVGYHDGSGKVSVDTTGLAAANIKQGITILGVTGTMTGSESVTVQSKSATPAWSEQTISPDSGYDYLSSVTVAAIPMTRTTNGSTGGDIVTIG